MNPTLNTARNWFADPAPSSAHPHMLVVTRWVDDVRTPTLPSGLLTLSPTRPFRRNGEGAWTAEAQLLDGSGRAVELVEICVSLWSDCRGELSIRPLRPKAALRWSAGRQRRYFDLAHRAADDLADVWRRADARAAYARPRSI